MLARKLKFLLLAEQFILLQFQRFKLGLLILEQLVRVLLELLVGLLGRCIFLLEFVGLLLNFIDLREQLGGLFIREFQIALEQIPYSVLERDHKAGAFLLLGHLLLVLCLDLCHPLFVFLLRRLLVPDSL